MAVTPVKRVIKYPPAMAWWETEQDKYRRKMVDSHREQERHLSRIADAAERRSMPTYSGGSTWTPPSPAAQKARRRKDRRRLLSATVVLVALTYAFYIFMMHFVHQGDVDQATSHDGSIDGLMIFVCGACGVMLGVLAIYTFVCSFLD